MQIKHELDVHLNVVEAEVTLAGLLEDRATLQRQLDALNENPHSLDQSHIRNIEEDIELRSVQIQDLQQKILDLDEGILILRYLQQHLFIVLFLQIKSRSLITYKQ